MAEKSKHTSSNNSRKESLERKRTRRIQIFLLLAMVVGLLVALAILGYSREDEAIANHLGILDVARVLFDEHIKAQAAQIQNKLGLLGALIANLFVNDTVGYASIIVPILIMMWCWKLLRRRELARLITFSNHALIGALLFSTALGVGNLIFGIEKEWIGLMGSFSADVMVKLLGTFGASIVLVTLLFVATVLAIDLDIHKSVERFKLAGETIWLWITQKEEEAIHLHEPPGTDAEVFIQRHGEESVAPQEADEAGELPAVEPETREEVRYAGFDLSPVRIDGEGSLVTAEAPSRIENDEEEIDYIIPSVELLDAPRQADAIPEDELKANAELVRSKLANFGVDIESVGVTPGPVITQYELVPADGVKISRIVSLADDLALALAAKGIRIMAPIPGKSAVGVEIPNKNPSIVYLRSVINSTKYRETKALLPIALGKTISGEVFTDDLSRMPHLLIAGSTGSGKSVGINTILASLLFKLHPSDVKFVIIDPKKIELTLYGKLKNHFLAISPDIAEDIVTTPENSVNVLKSVENEMGKRYNCLEAAGVRNIQDYNERLKSGRLRGTETVRHRKMPYLIVVIDELADLMMTAAREVEEPIARLAQLARAVGIHLVLATQRPSVDVITGLIKANFKARIAYQVASKTDSRTILDMNGAEQLLGNGDMLYLPPGSPKPIRIQNAYVSSDEVERIVDHISRQQGYSRPFQLPSVLDRKRQGMRSMSDGRDEFFEEAARLIVRHQQGSVSLLQRRLKVGYSRAARLVDELEAAGIVGPFDGSKARLVLVDTDNQLDRILETLE